MDRAAWSLEEATASTSMPTGRTVKAGDLVVIYEGYQSLKAAYMDPKQCHNCYAGAFLHKVLDAAAWRLCFLLTALTRLSAGLLFRAHFCTTCSASRRQAPCEVAQGASGCAGHNWKAIWQSRVFQGYTEQRLCTHPCTHARAVDAGAAAQNADTVCC